VKITRSQLKELVRKSIYEAQTVKFKDPETGDEHEITMDTAYKYKADIDAGDKSKEKMAAVKAAGLDKDTDDKQKEKPKPTKTTKISADPFGDKEKPKDEPSDMDTERPTDEPEGDVGGPSYPNVPKGVKTSKQAKDRQIGDFIDKYDHLIPYEYSSALEKARDIKDFTKADKIMKAIEKKGEAG